MHYVTNVKHTIVLKREKDYAFSKLQRSPSLRDQRRIIIIIEKVSGVCVWMRFFCFNSSVCESRTRTRAHTLVVVDSCTWHTSVILVVSARDTSDGAHIAPRTPRFTPVCLSVRPFVRSFVRSSGSTAEHKCPQEERYRGIWLGPPGQQNRPSGRAVSNPLRFSCSWIGFSGGQQGAWSNSELPGYLLSRRQ